MPRRSVYPPVPLRKPEAEKRPGPATRDGAAARGRTSRHTEDIGLDTRGHDPVVAACSLHARASRARRTQWAESRPNTSRTQPREGRALDDHYLRCRLEREPSHPQHQGGGVVASAARKAGVARRLGALGIADESIPGRWSSQSREHGAVAQHAVAQHLQCPAMLLSKLRCGQQKSMGDLTALELIARV